MTHPCAVCPRQLGSANARAVHERRAHPEWTATSELTLARTRAKERRYREAHPDRTAEGRRRYNEAHPDRVRESEARYRAGHREETRAASRAYRRTPEGRAKAAVTRQEQVASGKHSARMALQRAVDRGDLTREPCAICRAPRAEAHHYLGYERRHWLHVVWLCDQHHADAHHPEAADVRRRVEQVA